MLDIYAGETALKTIQQHGFKQELFTNFLGASGGPKWFVLFGLDKYLFGNFFKGREQELDLVGSSAGAFRAACLAQKDPVAAISRLAESYSETVYSAKPTPAEITTSAVELLDYVFDKHGVDEIINNPIIKAHFIVAKSKGLTSFENKISQTSGLLASYLLNKIDRGLLRFQYQRFVYKSPSSSLFINDPCQFNTQYIDLTPDNIRQALLASGSIPLVMSGIKNIKGSPKGMYRDGGIIDYHFDIEMQKLKHGKAQSHNGLVLYPHFTSQPKAGWFDKNSSRQVLAKHYQNTVLLVPSEKFIASLPYQKIPDRNDFTQLDSASRIKYWKTVLSATQQLADNLDDLIQRQNFNKIRPLL